MAIANLIKPYNSNFSFWLWIITYRYSANTISVKKTITVLDFNALALAVEKMLFRFLLLKKFHTESFNQPYENQKA
jgi:hypothetical protein